MFYRNHHVQTQSCQKQFSKRPTSSYVMQNDRSVTAPVSCDQFTYNWLHNTQVRDGSMTPPVSCSSQTYNWFNQQQHQIIPQVALDNTMPYRCNFVGQLQGSYEVEVAGRVDIVNVSLPELDKGEQQHAIARWIHKDRKAFPDKYIIEEYSNFKLCFKDGTEDAIMVKGMNMKVSVEWTMKNGSKMIWRRTSDVVFDIFSLVDLNSRRGSISSVCSLSSLVSTNKGWKHEPVMGHHGNTGEYIRSELHVDDKTPEYKITLLDGENPEERKGSSDDSVDCSLKKKKFTLASPVTIVIPPETTFLCTNSITQCPSCHVIRNENECFRDIVKLCDENPSIMKHMMQWKKQTTTNLTKLDYDRLSRGRMWVTARLLPKTKDNAWQGAINELKGAYQESEIGSMIYIQAAPSHSNVRRHRLRRSSRNLWVIELQHGGTNKKWSTCVEEILGRQWIDHRYEGRFIEITVVPLISILEKMGERNIPENPGIEKCLEFLFSTCNQKKLSSKLKTRNLKHNIANLKAKLDKQYSLAFAVQLSNIAVKIVEGLR